MPFLMIHILNSFVKGFNQYGFKNYNDAYFRKALCTWWKLLSYFDGSFTTGTGNENAQLNNLVMIPWFFVALYIKLSTMVHLKPKLTAGMRNWAGEKCVSLYIL